LQFKTASTYMRVSSEGKLQNTDLQKDALININKHMRAENFIFQYLSWFQSIVLQQ